MTKWHYCLSSKNSRVTRLWIRERDGHGSDDPRQHFHLSFIALLSIQDCWFPSPITCCFEDSDNNAFPSSRLTLRTTGERLSSMRCPKILCRADRNYPGRIDIVMSEIINDA